MSEDYGIQRQGAGRGSLYIAGSFFVSGVLTYVFQSLSARMLGPEGYGSLAILWSATFITVQVLWIWSTQTLGRYIAENKAQSRDWGPVLSSVRRLQLVVLVIFLLLCLAAAPFVAIPLFEGWTVSAAFVAAVAAYAPEYFRRGVFNGHRQFSRLGAMHVTETASRALIAALLLLAGAGVVGPALAIVLAPLVSVMLVKPGVVEPPEHAGNPFNVRKALGFATPVLVCLAAAQALANGGPILVISLGGTREQAGLLLAALILTRIPQYVLSPAIHALLPHASRTLATEGRASLDRFVSAAAGAVALVGMGMVAGVWLFGEWAMRLLYGPGFDVGRGVLVLLAVLAAFYLISETLNQALFTLGAGRMAAAGWVAVLPVAIAGMLLLEGELLYRASLSLALAALVAALLQAVFYLIARSSASGT